MKNLVKKVRDGFWYVMVAGAIVDVIFNKLCIGWLYIVLLIVGLGALIWGDHLQHGRKLFDMTKDEVSRSINMGEALMNVLGVLYIPAIFMCVSSEWLELREKIIVSIAVIGIIVELNCRIYKYKERLRSLEKTE